MDSLNNWENDLEDYIFSQIENNNFIYKIEIREYISNHKLPRKKALEFLTDLVDKNELKEKTEDGKTKGKIFYEKSNEKKCSVCNNKHLWTLYCQYCGKIVCPQHYYNFKNRIICKQCIKKFKFCSACIRRSYSDLSYLFDDVFDDLSQAIWYPAFNVGVLLKIEESYYCDNPNCKYHHTKIQELDNILDIENIEDKIAFYLYGSIETNVNISDNIDLMIVCKKCGKTMRITLEKTEPEIIEERENGMGPEYSYSKTYDSYCDNCSNDIEVTVNYSYYACEEDYVDSFVYGCIIITPDYKFLNSSRNDEYDDEDLDGEDIDDDNTDETS